MTDKSRMALDLIGNDDQVSWVRDQLNASLIEGITQSGRDGGAVEAMAFEFGAELLSARDRNKRETYETSRPYEEREKLDLIRDALFEVYVAVPALQMSAIESLKALGLNVSEIAFLSTSQEGQSVTSSEHRVEMTKERANLLRRRFDDFAKRLSV